MNTTADWQPFFDGLRSLIAHEQAEPVRAPYDRGLPKSLPLNIGKEGSSISEVVEGLVQIGKITPSTSAEQFFNQLFGGRIEVATMADMLASFFNNSMYTYKVAGVHAFIEQTLIRRMCDIAGFPDGDGAFTPGGSLSNMLGMLIAREERFTTSTEDGLSGHRAVAYTSDQSHYSIRKNAMMTGIGRRQLRKVETDARGRMKADALDAAIRRDLTEGYVPFFVNLTAGTTVLGAFDPIEELTEVAHGHGLWVHVDGAFGGSMLLSETHRHRLVGLPQVDSFTWDAHKLMGVPLTSSVCLFREPGSLLRHMNEDAGYLFQGGDALVAPGKTSMQCGRRNDALKLWAAWKHYGDNGYAARMDGLMEMAQFAASVIRETPGLTLVKDPESVNVCFAIDGVEAPALCDALNQHGRAMVGHANVDGSPIVRLAVSAPTTKDALRKFFSSVVHTADELRAAD